MVEQFYTITTQAGKAKIANASALGNKVNFTHFALGDGNGGYYNPTETQTALKKEVWRGNIGQIVVDENNPSWIVLETIIPAEVGGFTIREAGVFDDEGNLLAIGKYPETYKPLLENGSAKDLYIRMILEVSNTSVVNLKVDPSIILATKKDIDILSNRITKNESDILKNKSDIAELKQGSTTIEDLQTENKTLAGAINELEKIKAGKDYVRDYTDSQIALVTETGIPKLNIYEYKFHNVAIGTTEIQIPLESFDKATDTVKLYINAIPRDSDFFTISNVDNKIILNQGLQQVSKITLEVWKNVPIGQEGSVSGIVIAPDSMPLNRVNGLVELSEKTTRFQSEYLVQVSKGTENAIEITTDGDFQYIQGNRLMFQAAKDSTGAVSINIDDKGQVPLKKITLGDVSIKANKVYEIFYNASDNCFFLLASAEGDAVAENVLAGKIFSNDDDTGLLGTMPNRGTVNITPSQADQVIANGYHNGVGKVLKVPVPVANVLTGTTIAGAAGTMPNRGALAQTLTTQGGHYNIPAGYYSGGSVKAQFANLVAGNIKNRVNVGGVVGTYNPLAKITDVKVQKLDAIHAGEERRISLGTNGGLMVITSSNNMLLIMARGGIPNMVESGDGIFRGKVASYDETSLVLTTADRGSVYPTVTTYY